MSEKLVDRRRRLLRDEIGRIAVGLFVECGFDAVTADEIAAAAGISQRTLFRYFASKEEIALDLARRLHRRLIAALEARPASEGAFTALKQAYCQTSHVEPGERQRVVQVARVLAKAPSLRARAHGEPLNGHRELHALLARRMGVSAGDRRVRVLTTATVAVATAEFYRWADRGGRGDPSVAIAAALGVLEGGFGELDELGRAPRKKRATAR